MSRIWHWAPTPGSALAGDADPKQLPQDASWREAGLKKGRILIVDDEPQNILLLRRLLERNGYHTIADTIDPTTVLSLHDRFRPDLVCLDLNMPRLDGFGVLRELAPVIPPGTYLPVLMLTGDSSPGVKQRALSMGAKDFVYKPFDPDEVLLRIHNLLVPRFMHLELQRHNDSLECAVRERTATLAEARIEVLDRLARAAEFRDDDTGQHTRRVGRTAALLGKAAGLAADAVELLERAAPLHDVGKIGIPDNVLLKPGRLDAEELAIMRRHTTIGAEILSGGNTALMRLAQEIAMNHHERWDGTGYPNNRTGNAIPVAARIVAIADVFDALTHARPYRDAWPLDRVLHEIHSEIGRHFDPAFTSVFLQLPHSELI